MIPVWLMGSEGEILWKGPSDTGRMVGIFDETMRSPESYDTELA